MRLEGRAKLGDEFDDAAANRNRGCEVTILGILDYDLDKETIKRFDVVGLGLAWDSKKLSGPLSLEAYPWQYGIAWELVTRRDPIDVIPPYNLFHYNGSGKPYFPKE